MSPTSTKTTIQPLATLTPTCNTRTWLSAPHPRLPLLATACSDRSARIYSLQSFTQHARATGGHKRSVRSCAWKDTGGAGGGETVLATGSFDASAAIWKHGGQQQNDPAEIDFTKGLAGGDDDDDDGDGDGDDQDEWRLEVILDGHDSEIKSVAFCPTGPLLATSSRDKSVWIWEELEGDDFETVAVLQEHEGDVKTVAWHPTEQLLASGSYDDMVRLWREDVDDWACCTLLQGHEGTVWWVEFEGVENIDRLEKTIGNGDEEKKRGFIEQGRRAGPRLMTCSDDLTVRIWSRVPKDRPQSATGQARLPSIWKNRDFEEEWVEQARLPQQHERAVYAISWSRKTGRVLSTGSDGKIAVYEERWKPGDVEMEGDTSLKQDEQPNGEATTKTTSLTEWVVIAEFENAHDVFEVNHVTWAPRADKGKRHDQEEIIVSTGDDGEVKIWTLEE